MTGRRAVPVCALAVAVATMVVSGRGARTQPPPPGSDVQRPLVLTLQVAPNARPKTLELLAEVSEPSQLAASGLQSVKQIVRAEYGSFNAATYAVFKRYNAWAANAERKPTGQVTVPAGPRWAFHVTTTIPPGGTVWNQAFTKMGVAGPKTLGQIADANPALRSDAIHNLLAGTKVRLPYRASVVSYRLRPEYVERTAEIMKQLEADPAVLKAEIGWAPRLVPQWTSAQLSAAGAECGGTHAATLQIDSLVTGVALDKLRPLGRALVAVLDSGVPRDDARFERVLWRNSEEENGREGEDDDQNGYVDDVVGWNFISRGFPEDDVETPDQRNHGTHVAGLVSGRLLPKGIAQLLEDRLRLMILKVARSDGYVDVGAVHDAIAYAQEKVAQVVNLSFEGEFSKQTRETMAGARGLLFVVAAGNGRAFHGIDLDTDNEGVFPAKHARELENVVSVGAHDQLGHLACFSNFGRETVDLVAPGLDIESTVRDTSTRLSGTSQAAPLVSLAAALLMSLDLREPKLVKRRLLASVDFVPELQGKIRSEGKLNLVKAVGIDYDLLQRSDGSLVAGTVVEPTALHNIPGETVPTPIRSVQKIVFNYPTAQGFKERVMFLKGGTVRYAVVEPDKAPIALKLADGRRVEFRREELQDLVMASARDRR